MTRFNGFLTGRWAVPIISGALIIASWIASGLAGAHAVANGLMLAAAVVAGWRIARGAVRALMVRDIGIDALNTQIFCIGVDKLAQFKGDITFWGEIDRQHILADEPVETVRRSVKLVKDTLWQDGGCIAQCEFSAGSRPENVYTVFETWEQLSR